MENIISSILSENDIKEWKDFTEKNRANYFQGIKGYNHFKVVPNYNPVVILAKNNNKIIGSLMAVIIVESGIKGKFSKRSIIWGGPIIDAAYGVQNQVVDSLLKMLNKSYNAIYTEFRNFSDTTKVSKAFQSNGYTFYEHLNFIVKVGENEDESIALLNSSKRRQVRKSIKEGARIEKAESIEQVKGFYNILENLYRTKVKKPIPSFEFFEAFFTQNAGVYLLVFKEEELLGGIMCPIDIDTIYEYYIAGLDGKYKNIYPSVLATWAPIDYATKNSLKQFDFLGAGKPDEDYGVRDFKSKFGGDLVEYGRYKRINKPLIYKIGILGLKFMQKLK